MAPRPQCPLVFSQSSAASGGNNDGGDNNSADNNSDYYVALVVLGDLHILIHPVPCQPSEAGAVITSVSGRN